MTVPSDLVPLIDGDVIRYEIGFAAEAGWRAMHPDIPKEECIPPFSYVREILHKRLADICTACNTSKSPVLYITEGPTFRFDIAKKKPYKGTRKENKPWHYKNLTVHMIDTLGAKVVHGIEADDQMAIDHVSSNSTTILCSRDKDLRQVPGWFYSWELGNQPSFGPELITKEGWIKLGKKRDKIVGTGLAFFYSQVLTGDAVDNIPGLPGCGPVAAFEMLSGKTPEEQLKAVLDAYWAVYGNTIYMSGQSKADIELLEQGRLCWLTRRLHEYNPHSDPQEYYELDGTPVLWEIGMTE